MTDSTSLRLYTSEDTQTHMKCIYFTVQPIKGRKYNLGDICISHNILCL